MVRNGKRAPHSLPSGDADAGPVEPWHPPIMFGATTNHSSVSIAFAGADDVFPPSGGRMPGAGLPDEVAVARQRVQDEDRVVPGGVQRAEGLIGDPHLAGARRRARASACRSRRTGGCRRGSPSRQAPVAGGLPSIARALASVMKAEGTVSSGVCQSMLSFWRRRPCGAVGHRERPGGAEAPWAAAIISKRGTRRRHVTATARSRLVLLEVAEVLYAFAAEAPAVRAAARPASRSAFRSSTFSRSDRETHEARSDTGRELLLRA